MSNSTDGASEHHFSPVAYRLTTVIALIGMLCASRNVRADGWKVQLQGVKALGLSYAGRSVYIDDASTVWFNPAGMRRLTNKWTITTAAPLITYGLAYTDRGSTSVLGQSLTGPAVADGGRTSPVPHGYVVRKFNDRWWGGFGLNFPFGLGSDYGETWVGRYHATKTELTVLNLNPTLAVKINDRLSLGVGLDVQRANTRLANMIDFGSLGAAVGLPLVPQANDGKIELDATHWGVGSDLSLAWDVSRRSRFGLTYRSQIEHKLEGTAHFAVPAAAAPLTAGGALFKDTRAISVLPMPHEVSASGSYELGAAWTLVGDLTWTDWSRFRQFTVTFANPLQPPVVQSANFDNSLRSAIGAIFRASGTWEIRTGALYETTPVPDSTRTPRLPEVNNAGISAGASYRLGDRGDIDVSFSHLMPHNATIVLHDPAAGQLVGSVRWRLDILAASVNLRF
jgi:long-chain fatty acid transport protein